MKANRKCLNCGKPVKFKYCDKDCCYEFYKEKYGGHKKRQETEEQIIARKEEHTAIYGHRLGCFDSEYSMASEGEVAWLGGDIGIDEVDIC